MAEPAGRPRTRPVLAVVGGTLAVLGAFMLPFAVGVTRSPELQSASAEVNFISNVIVVAIGSVLPLTLGLWLLYRGAPSLTESIMRGAAAATRPAFWLDAARRVLAAFVPSRTRLSVSPLRRAGYALALAGAAAVVSPRGLRWVAIFVAFTVYSVADPSSTPPHRGGG
jgi:hypothetical protein